MPCRSGTMTVPAYAQCKHGNQVAVVGAEDTQKWKQRAGFSARDEAVGFSEGLEWF